MTTLFRDRLKRIRIITLLTLLSMVCLGAAMVLAQVKPFWVDEWFIIYSLKTKGSASLFGQLAFMQQFPRVYLVLLKSFTSFFNYSYFSLRLPSFLVSVTAMILSYKMMKKIYREEVFTRYLFVLILISSYTFTEYLVDMKQYPMEILMSIVALWQLAELFYLKNDNRISIKRYVLLCASFFIVPFFSYTYLIAIAPVYALMLLQTITIFKSNKFIRVKWRITIMQWLPLAVRSISICLFYVIDASHLATDNIMYDRWSSLIFDEHNKLHSFFTSFYTLFSQTGSGFIYENLFGILGVSAFIYGVVSCLKDYIKEEDSLEMQLRIYSCLLLALTLVLFLCKKLPLGSPRLNSFTTPSIAILIICLLNRVAISLRSDLQKIALPAILYIGVIGNIFSYYINYFTDPAYKKQMSIYASTEKAIRLAQSKVIPMYITTGVAYPYYQGYQSQTDPINTEPAVWVLKTFPAYNITEQIPVYTLKDIASADIYIEQHSPNTTTALAGDGISFKIYSKTK